MPTISFPISTPLYSGSGSSDEVPGLYPVGINGRGFLLDIMAGGIKESSVPLLKAQQEDAGETSEKSLNPAALWRQVCDTWHKGAGQPLLDLEDSDPAKFDTSKGIDPWTRGQFGLHFQTYSVTASANMKYLANAGAYWYYQNGNEVYWKPDITAGAGTAGVIAAGEGAIALNHIVSDGSTVYAATTANGIHTTTAGATSSSHYSDLNASLLGFVKGRLMAVGAAASDHILYNVIASGAAPAALFTHPNTSFTWVGFAEGPNHIYAAGYSGDKSIIYKTAIVADGTALATPSVAGRLPDGEIVRSIGGYLDNFIFLGTDTGVRFATADSNGNLEIGGLIDLGKACRCFEGQDKYVWFGIDNYDAPDTGLGRLTPRFLDDELRPAYATDLMATTQGQVLSVITFGDKRVFSVSGVGGYAEDTIKVASGTLTTGEFTYRLPERKVMMEVESSTAPLDGTVQVELSPDQGSYL